MLDRVAAAAQEWATHVAAPAHHSLHLYYYHYLTHSLSKSPAVSGQASGHARVSATTVFIILTHSRQSSKTRESGGCVGVEL